MSQQPDGIHILGTLKAFAREFDSHLEGVLRVEEGVPHDLAEAVRYAALAPGKRVRPFLVVSCCELLGGERGCAWPAAAAVECIHAFSLVHDDLPAMDNDDLRRGQPTTHKKFGEALGILAGDALVVRAFEIVAREYTGLTWDAGARRRGDAETRQDGGEGGSQLAGMVALELARATGWAGMIAGQADDLAGQRAAPSVELTRAIHARKTGRLFKAACRIGAMIGVQSSVNPPSLREDGPPAQSTGGSGSVCGTSGTLPREGISAGVACERGLSHRQVDLIERLGRFGGKLGEAFQIADDVLDMTATAEELGKSPGKDAAANKQTYPRCVGVEASKAAAERAAEGAIAELEPFGPEADDLRALARYVIDRNY